MESQPQNPEFRNNPENFHPCKLEILKFFYHQFQGKLDLTDTLYHSTRRIKLTKRKTEKYNNRQ